MSTAGLTLRSRSTLKIDDHIGKVYGDRTVLGLAPRGKWSYQMWAVRCACGTEGAVPGRELLRGRMGRCVDCQRRKQSGSKHPSWRGLGAVTSTGFNHFRHSALKRGIPWSLSIEDVSALYEQQGGRCAMTGRPIAFRRGNRFPGRHLASLDRIDNRLPYVVGNVQLVTGDVNMAKQMLSVEDFVALCRDVVRTMDEACTR